MIQCAPNCESLCEAAVALVEDNLREVGEVIMEKSGLGLFPELSVEMSPSGVVSAPDTMENEQAVAFISNRLDEGFPCAAYSVFPKILPGQIQPEILKSPAQKNALARFGCADDELTRILFGGNAPAWIAPEVGGGENNIGIIAPFQNRMKRVAALEWQNESASEKSIERLLRIVNELTHCYTPNIPSIITPVLAAQKTSGELPREFLEAAARFNAETEGRTCEPLRLVEFEVNENGIHYAERDLSG